MTSVFTAASFTVAKITEAIPVPDDRGMEKDDVACTYMQGNTAQPLKE